MKNIQIKKKILLFIIIFNLFNMVFIPSSNGIENQEWWDKNFSFRQEIYVPIDTSIIQAKYQPIDTQIIFNEPCWARNELEHSVRVIMHDNGEFLELESQIYDLVFLNNNQIKSCSLVFLIPEESTGNERYFAYYDDDEKCGPGYPDHVDIEEDYYLYEPIPGIPFELSYYKITDNGNIVYGVSYGGEFLGYGTAQQITKFNDNTKEITTPKDAQCWASFDYFYYYGNKADEFSSTIEKITSKEILTDGTLMVEFRITSETNRQEFSTTGTYKYYYSPKGANRIFANIKHKALKKSYPYKDGESFGNILSFQIGKMKSSSIHDLNFGRMFPYMHVYSEDNKILEYPIDENVEYVPEGIPILQTKDDIDLGKKAWTSFDEGEIGAAHSIILDSTDILTSGTNERNGVQVQGLEASSPGLLGIDLDTATYYFSRNVVEEKSSPDAEVPDDFVVEFNAEFYTTESGGYKSVDSESEIFQKLVKIRPIRNNISIDEENNSDNYFLKTYVHFAPSTPLGSFLSMITGKNFSYITAELYKEDKQISMITAKRGLTYNKNINLKDLKLFERIKLGISNLKNFSISKKVIFNNLEPGKYIVKIFKENPLLGDKRKYIGYKIVDIKDSTSTHIFCTSQEKITVSVSDQNGKAVEDVRVNIIDGSTIVSSEKTSKNGICEFSIPFYNKDLFFSVNYKEFEVYNETINPRFFNIIQPIKKSINLELYDLKFNFIDSWGFPIDYDIYPKLMLEDDSDKNILSYEIIKNNQYYFKNLLSGLYNLKIKYKSQELVKNNIELCNDKEVCIEFPLEYEINLYAYDSRGLILNQGDIIISRENQSKKIQINKDGFSQIKLPQGEYKLKIFNKDNIVYNRKINIRGERDFELVAEEAPLYPIIIVALLIIFQIIVGYNYLKKKKYINFIKLSSASLIFISIFSPWWTMVGTSQKPFLESNTNLYIFPPEIITITRSNNILSGERGLGFLGEISDLLVLFSIILIIAGLLIFLSIFFTRFKRIMLSHLSNIISISFLTGCMLLFYYGMSILTSLGLGSFSGSGNLDIYLPGEEISLRTFSSWGPGVGFYLCLTAVFLLIIIQIYYLKIRINKSI